MASVVNFCACRRPTWNNEPGEKCCRACGTAKHHDRPCNAKAMSPTALWQGEERQIFGQADLRWPLKVHDGKEDPVNGWSCCGGGHAKYCAAVCKNCDEGPIDCSRSKYPACSGWCPDSSYVPPGDLAFCNCGRVTWNGFPGEYCCHKCKSTPGRHDQACESQARLPEALWRSSCGRIYGRQDLLLPLKEHDGEFSAPSGGWSCCAGGHSKYCSTVCKHCDEGPLDCERSKYPECGAWSPRQGVPQIASGLVPGQEVFLGAPADTLAPWTVV